MIDINKKYRTRDGRDVVIYAINGAGNYPVHGKEIWSVAVFIRMDDGLYVTAANFIGEEGVLQTTKWDKCKPIPESFLAILESVI